MAESLAGHGRPGADVRIAAGSFQEADYLAHEVPDVHIPADVLGAMQQAGRSARETGLELAWTCSGTGARWSAGCC